MQLDYSQTMPVGMPGMIADAGRVQDIETFSNPSGPLTFGRLATKGVNDNEVTHPDAAGEVTDLKLVRGVVVATHEQVSAYPNNGLAAAYVAKTPTPIMRKGRIWVVVEDAVTAGVSDVHARVSGPNLGAFRASADGSNTAVCPKARYLTSTSGPNQLAVLEIDL